MVVEAALPLLDLPLLFMTPDGRTKQWESPGTKKELQETIETCFGLRFALEPECCPGHTAPIDYLWDVYSGAVTMATVLASRGYGGKSAANAVLGALKLLDGADVSVLGGSYAQSQRVHEILNDIWTHDTPVYSAETGEPVGYLSAPLLKQIGGTTQYMTRMLEGGNWLRALTASTRSARGPHPQVLILDEVDEMDLLVLEAALGQTMVDGVSDLAARHMPLTILSSTLHYPDGTFAEVLKRGLEKGWARYSWCYRENLVSNGGWLEDSEVDRKKSEVTFQQWETEYELQEPSSEGRAFDIDAVKAMFAGPIQIDDKVNRYYELQLPHDGAAYATGADWARTRDYTVIATIRYDVKPARLVAYERLRRRPWPSMIERFNKRLERYPGKAAHDAIGVGDVVNDLIVGNAYAFRMQGQPRENLWTDYIKAVEAHEVSAPKISSLLADHLYCRHEDLYRSGETFHPPDSVVAMAMAWMAARGRAHAPGKKPGRVLQVRYV